MRRRYVALLALLLVAALLAIPPLLALWRAGRPIPVVTLQALDLAAPRMLVVVLPGIGDDLGTLQASRVAEAIQQAQPGAEVALTAASFRYYLRRNLVKRLHEGIVQPARARGIASIWLVGASLGGFGALLYEHAHPGEMSGLVLLAPFTGRPGLRQSIIDAGGLARWQPGPRRPAWHPDQVPLEIWRMVRSWGSEPELAQRVWLASGTQDKFLPAVRLIAPVLPQGHAREVSGGHNWKVWAPAAGEVFRGLRQAPPLPGPRGSGRPSTEPGRSRAARESHGPARKAARRRAKGSGAPAGARVCVRAETFLITVRR